MPKVCYCGNENLIDYSETYYVCNECHTLVSKGDTGVEACDVKDEDSDLYGSNYWKKSMVEMSGENSLEGVVDHYLKERVAYWIEYILRYVPIGSRVAEIGCGLGQLAYVMKTIGYKQLAFELSPEICEFIRNTLNVNMHCGEFGETNEIFDAVLAFDLLEHIANPKEFLEKIYDSLSDNGVLCVQMPNFDYNLSFQEMRKQKPRFEVQLKEKEHLFLYSKEAIVALLKQVGFQEVRFETSCFGEDYDMFFFAGKKKMNPIAKEQAEEALDNVKAGRIVKALCSLYEENRKIAENLKKIEVDSAKRLESIKILEEALRVSEKDRSDRLDVIESCNERILEQHQTITELQEKLVLIETDSAARLENNKVLERALRKSEADIAARLESNKMLQELLKESQKDRAEQLIIIENCNKKIFEHENAIIELQHANKLLTEKNNRLCEMQDVYFAEIRKKKRGKK